MIKTKRFWLFLALTVVYFSVTFLFSIYNKGMQAALKIDWKDVVFAIAFGLVMTAFLMPRQKADTEN